MSAAKTIRLSRQRGIANPATARRSRAISTWPLFTASYSAPWPRRRCGANASPRQRPHRPVRAQHRVGELEQRVGSGGQARVQLAAEPRQRPSRVTAVRPGTPRRPAGRLCPPLLDRLGRQGHTERHGHRPLSFEIIRTDSKMIKRWPCPCHADTPNNTNDFLKSGADMDDPGEPPPRGAVYQGNPAPQHLPSAG
jgi:hypothetical protein